MDKNYYVEYYGLERNHWWFKARQEILRNHIQSLVANRQPIKILNIGVATGATSIALQEFGEVKSVEYDKECFLFTKKKLGIDIDNESITAMPYADESFDLVCAFDVIEHVEDHVTAVSEMKRVCKQEGYIVVTVPAYQSLWGTHDEVNHHIRRYKKNEFKNLFEGSGQIIFSTYFNFYLFPLIYLFRNLARIFPSTFKRKGSGSDFSVKGQNRFDKIFYRILRSERVFFNNGTSLPFGVSILLSWKKKPGNSNQLTK